MSQKEHQKFNACQTESGQFHNSNVSFVSIRLFFFSYQCKKKKKKKKKKRKRKNTKLPKLYDSKASNGDIYEA